MRLHKPDEHALPVSLDIAVQISRGLLHLHEDANMVHRDLKPPNILLTDKLVVKLCDFGISSGGHTNSVDHAGVARVEQVGTLPYLAPECFQESFRIREMSRTTLRPSGGSESRSSISLHVGDGQGDWLTALRFVQCNW